MLDDKFQPPPSRDFFSQDATVKVRCPSCGAFVAAVVSKDGLAFCSSCHRKLPFRIVVQDNLSLRDIANTMN